MTLTHLTHEANRSHRCKFSWSYCTSCNLAYLL